MKFTFTAITFCVLLSSFTAAQEKAEDLQQLSDWMTGSFSSEEQAKADSNFYNIHLKMVRIWNKRSDAIWLYVEQAAAWKLDKPYRQRVYRLKQLEDGRIESRVYAMKHPLRFTGEWKKQNPLAGLTPDSLTIRNGCAIFIKKEGDAFIGSTDEKKCESKLRGATYATSEVRIEKDRLTSWDRGWDKKDKQVWGAETGPYIFLKNDDL